MGQIIRALREARGWNQTELGKRAGLPPAHISQIESGRKKNLTQRTLEGLAGAFEMPMPQFMQALGVNQERPPAGFEDVVTSAQARQLLELWSQVSDADRIGFLAQLKALAEVRRQIREAEEFNPEEPETIEYMAGFQANGKPVSGK